MTTAGGFETLVLNADYRPVSYFPLSVWSWQDAIKALVLGRVSVVSEYDQSVRSPSTHIKLPSVISLKRHVKNHGNYPALTRANVFLRDAYACQYCGVRFDSRTLTLDHVIPRAKGGKSTWNNLVSCCHPCNGAKGDKLPGKHFREPMHKPRMPTTAQLQRINRELFEHPMPDSWLDFI